MGLEALAQTALNLINTYGKTAYINRVSDVSYDVSSGRAEASESRSSFKAVISDFRGRELNNEGIQRGDKKFLAAAQDFDEPSPGDEITVDDDTFLIVGPNQTIYAGEIAAVYILQGRKA